MTYSFTQISQYLRCPRQYRYRYLDGWREREDKAAMMFGRSFENALAVYFAQEDSTAAFFRNGASTRMPPSPMPRTTPGTGSITRAFTCSNGLLRRIVFGYDVQKRIFK